MSQLEVRILPVRLLCCIHLVNWVSSEHLSQTQQAAFDYQCSQASENKSRLRLLALDGGGIRGICLIQMLLYIQSKMGDSSIADHFDWIGGTSTGAIVALALADGRSLDQVLRLYLRLKDDVFSGSRPHSPAPLEALLKEQFGTRTMSQLKLDKKVMVTTAKADMHPPRLVLFRNYTLPPTLVDTSPAKEAKIWKVARCSRFGWHSVKCSRCDKLQCCTFLFSEC